jgi:hypothetical protein
VSDAKYTHYDETSNCELSLNTLEVRKDCHRLTVTIKECEIGGTRVEVWLPMDDGRRLADAIENGRPFKFEDASGDVIEVEHGTLKTAISVTDEAGIDGPTRLPVVFAGNDVPPLLDELRSLTGAGEEQPEPFVPRTEREYWVDIAAALNAAQAAGMPVGIDLDGTLTDHRAWSVVWDRAAERWTVSGYDDDIDGPAPEKSPLTVYRASYDSEEMGLFATREAARAQCEAHERRDWQGGAIPVFKWVPDDAGDEASPEELRVSVTTYADGSETGYVVTPLVVPSEYVEEADE